MYEHMDDQILVAILELLLQLKIETLNPSFVQV